MPLLASFSFWHIIGFIFSFFLMASWLYIMVLVLGDLFLREMSGWGKAAWTFLILFLPFLGILLYLVVRPRPSEEAIRSFLMRS